MSKYIIPPASDLPTHKHVQSPKTLTFKIYGGISLEYYYVNLYVGNPPQRQSVIFDTGSDLTAFPCDLCKEGHCGKHNNPIFDQKKTSTISDLKCDSSFQNWKCKACDSEG